MKTKEISTEEKEVERQTDTEEEEDEEVKKVWVIPFKLFQQITSPSTFSILASETY